MMKDNQEQFNKVLSVVNVNVFELMDLTLETFGHHLIHEEGVKGCRKNIDDLTLEQKKELYSKLSPLLSTPLTADNYIEYREVFRFASVLHCSIPFDYPRTEEHSTYFDKLSGFDYRQIDPYKEYERYKKRGYESYYIKPRDAFNSVYSNSMPWHKIRARYYGVFEEDQPLMTECSLSIIDYLTKASLEDYFKSQFRRIENDLVEGDYRWNMKEQLEDVFISEAFNRDFLIDSFINFFLRDCPSTHYDIGADDGLLQYYYTRRWGGNSQEQHPMLEFFESEPFTEKLRDRLSTDLILSCRNAKRFIKANHDALYNLGVFASVLSQFEAIESDDLDREIHHMTEQSDIHEHLNNFDVALLVASESFRLLRLANEKPKEARRQRKKFISELPRKEKLNPSGEPGETYFDHHLKHRLYNYCVLQKSFNHVYRDKRFPIPEYSRDSQQPYELIMSDKEVEFSDHEASYDFTQIFEFIQRFIMEKNKHIYEVWH